MLRRLKLCAWVLLPALAFMAICGSIAAIWGQWERPREWVTTIQGGDGYGRLWKAPPPSLPRQGRQP